LLLLLLEWFGIREFSFFFFFPSLNRFGTLGILSLFFFDASLWSRLSLLLLAVNSRWNCREKWLNDEDSPLLNPWELQVLFPNWIQLWFWSNWHEREKCELFVTWQNFCGSLWYAWPYIGWQVAAGPIEMWHVDLELLAWLKGPICKKVTIGTVLQIWKWDCFEKKWTANKNNNNKKKWNWDWFAIHITFGLKCNF